MEEFKGINILNFIKELPNDDACKAYLAKIKWQDGFICSKCRHTKGCEKSGYRYHCYSCQHVESATANTLFHKVKFGLQKVRKAMKSSQNYPLEKLIHVDEFTVGGEEEGKQGRSYDTKKKKAVIAVELTDDNKVNRR